MQTKWWALYDSELKSLKNCYLLPEFLLLKFCQITPCQGNFAQRGVIMALPYIIYGTIRAFENSSITFEPNNFKYSFKAFLKEEMITQKMIYVY